MKMDLPEPADYYRPTRARELGEAAALEAEHAARYGAFPPGEDS